VTFPELNNPAHHTEIYGNHLILVSILPDSPMFDEVLKLWGKNRQTLGFFPRGAFVEYSSRDQLFGIFADNRLLGYLLYRVSRSSLPAATIVHLCVDVTVRKKGCAKLLVGELKRRCQSLTGIGLHCRDDFPANSLWSHLGFAPRAEKSGRNSAGKILTYWWLDNDLPNLFDSLVLKSRKISAVLDSNIVYDFADSSRDEREQSVALLADWITGLADFAVTDEIFHEIHRGTEESQRRKNRTWASRFKRLETRTYEFEDILKIIQNDLIVGTHSNDISDAKHLAHAVVNEYRFFVTRDSNLVDLSPQMEERFDLRVVRPVDFVVELDSIEREETYRPYRLGASQVTQRRATASDLANLFNTFSAKARGEKKVTFHQKFDSMLSKPDRFSTTIYEDGNGQAILLVVQSNLGSAQEVCAIRFAQHRIAETVVRDVLNRIVLSTASSVHQRLVIVRTDSWSDTTELQHALQDCGFMPIHAQGWIKLSDRFVANPDSLSSSLIRLGEQIPEFAEAIQEIASVASYAWGSEDDANRLFAERLLWPTKRLNSSSNAVVIPIKPHWAKELFLESLAKEALFGVNDRLLLNWENVYYRSRRNYPSALTVPGTYILWYASVDTTSLQEIVACSMVEEIAIDTVANLYGRFKHLGVYRRRDLEEVAEKDSTGQLMAIRFSNTELFSHPIGFAEFKQKLMQTEGRSSQIQSPIKISAVTFAHLYARGYRLTEVP
jgi:predicted nucleic acid-binding protein/GNAT superfamily N-acetyltransferase